MSTPEAPQPHDQRLAEHVARLLREGGPIADLHEVAAADAYQHWHLWRVKVTSTDGAEWMVGPVSRYK